MLRRIGVLASLAVIAAMFAGVSTAQAQLTAGVCIFTGLSGELDRGDGNGIQDAVPDVGDGLIDVEHGNYFFSTDGGAGDIATCAGVFDVPAQIGNQPLVTDVSITSNGNYDNIVCGTGFAHDLDGAQTQVNGQLADGTPVSISGAGYEIPFVAGNGPLIIGPGGGVQTPALAEATSLLPRDAGAPSHAFDGTGAGLLAGEEHGFKTSNYTGVGAVHITPGVAPAFDPGNPQGQLQRDNCLSSPANVPNAGDPAGFTDSFEVAGFFVAAGG